ncbi:MAG: cupin domain-containing protein [Acidobacteria bacterium]|nr:cupin domain-containing protein [Acidobacteriota bacterium]
MSDPKIVNLADLPWTPVETSPSIAVETKDPARKLGSLLAGLRLYRLAPGKQSTRLHRHHHQEEMFLILSGAGTLRHGERRVPVKTGDFILYLADDPDPHTFVNTGTDPMEYLATGNRVSYEVCEYPEEGTVYVESLDRTLVNQDVPGAAEKIRKWYDAGR